MPNPKGNPKTLKHFKPTWKSGKTKVIRVPASLADEVLEYARILDSESPVTCDRQKILQLARELFALKSNAGGQIKEKAAQILTEFNFSVSHSNRKWEVQDDNNNSQ